MDWHAQVTSLTIRGYEGDGSFENHSPFVAIAQVEFLSQGVVFVHSFLKSNSTTITKRDWVNLVKLLKEGFGVKEITADRHDILKSLVSD